MLPSKLMCTTCDVSFTTVEGQLEHVKSESHVRRLRLRVAATDMATPLIQESYRGELCELPDRTSENSPQADSEDERPPKNNEMAGFYTENCLFCPQISASLDQSLAHMKTCHGFSIPYQHHLAVETETLIWYLHLVIFGFYECISCGKQRNTLEGVQHHMLEKGHGRFDMTDDMMEFYNSGEIKGHSNENGVRTDEKSLRLLCGKLLSNRSQAPYPGRPLQQKRHSIPIHDGSHAPFIRDRKGSSLVTHLLSLPVNERRNLAHLPDSMQIKYLARRRKTKTKEDVAARYVKYKMGR